MQIVYAPVGGFCAEDNYYLKNIEHGFDIQVLETLCDVLDSLGAGGGQIFSIYPKIPKILPKPLSMH